uniref:Uncharacterized protein n=1 Tax=Knipowitschia caucasica TaxID=637954 RepID=A0AAV2K966_KNICA
MGNGDSTFTCEGAELQPTLTWWGRGHRQSGRNYRKPHQPIRSQRQTSKQSLDSNSGLVERLGDPEVSSVRNGSLSSGENAEKSEVDLSHSWCQDSGFGESPGSSPDLVLKETETKDLSKTRVRKWSDWTGSLRIKKRRVQEPDVSIWLLNPDFPQIPTLNQTQSRQDQRLSLYQTFRPDLESKSTSTRTSSDRDSVPGIDQDQGLDRDHGQDWDQGLDRAVVRRAGWIWIKPLIKLNKDQLELVPWRKWKKYWVTLRGCWLQFFKCPTLDQDSEQDLDPSVGVRTLLGEGDHVGPVLELRVWDSLVQPVPEHPTKEHVFCVSNALGQVYLLQAGSQSDLEAWITAVHSVAAATASRRSGHRGDTLDFLRERVHFLSQKTEEEQRVKKMAALQLSLITEEETRRRVQHQDLSPFLLFPLSLSFSFLSSFLLSLSFSFLSSFLLSLSFLSFLLSLSFSPLSSFLLFPLFLSPFLLFPLLLPPLPSLPSFYPSLSLPLPALPSPPLFLPSIPSPPSSSSSPLSFAPPSCSSLSSFLLFPLILSPLLLPPLPSLPSSSSLSSLSFSPLSSFLLFPLLLLPSLPSPPSLSLPSPPSSSFLLSLSSFLLFPLLLLPSPPSLPSFYPSPSIPLLPPSPPLPLSPLSLSHRIGHWAISRWEQSVESLSLDLFRFRSYLCSLQGLELPNPKNPLCSASRASKSMLGKMGLFNVSTLHALVCSRDQATLRRHGHTLIGQSRERRSLIGRSIRRRRSFKSAVKSTQNQSEEDPAVTTAAVEEEKQEELTLQLSRTSSNLDYGFAVIGQVDKEGRSHIYISQVDPNGLSANQGLAVGDQVLSVNGASVSRLDLDLIPSVFSHRTLLLFLRRRNASPDPPANQEIATPSHDLRDTDSWTQDSKDPLNMEAEQSSDRVNSLYQIFPECRAADAEVAPYREAELHTPGPAHLSVCQRIRKVLEELLETEKSYVKDLSLLFDLYLTPLQHQSFLSQHEMEALFGSLPAMLDFQRVFLQTLEQEIDLRPDLSRPETRKLLFSLGGSFLYYADHFKLYSGFCSNHLRVQKVLSRAKTDAAFKHFLDTRNPTNQHSASLESFLIKPVQRVLKYPLLLRELVCLTEEKTPERTHLTEALRSMQKVACHINEMQKIYEEFGSVFERLTAQSSAPYGQVADLSMGDFLLRSSALWLNPAPSLGRMRKDPQLDIFVFKQAVILVFKDPKVKKRLVTRSDLDPVRFKWIIPASAAHIRDSITDSDLDLVHSDVDLETVFSLSFSDAEGKSLLQQALGSFISHDPPPPHPPPLNSTPSYRLQEDQLEDQLQRLHVGEEGRCLKQWRRSLVEMGGALDRDFSVQSLTSIINEDCFYNSLRRRKPRSSVLQ